jgi:hypothetical protein
MKLVKKGVFGIIGSPWQQAKTQTNQNAPVGTPSDGRPKGQVPKEKEKEKDANKKSNNPPKTESKVTVVDVVKGMTDEDFAKFQYELMKARNE